MLVLMFNVQSSCWCSSSCSCWRRCSYSCSCSCVRAAAAPLPAFLSCPARSRPCIRAFASTFALAFAFVSLRVRVGVPFALACLSLCVRARTASAFPVPFKPSHPCSWSRSYPYPYSYSYSCLCLRLCLCLRGLCLRLRLRALACAVRAPVGIHTPRPHPSSPASNMGLLAPAHRGWRCSPVVSSMLSAQYSMSNARRMTRDTRRGDSRVRIFVRSSLVYSLIPFRPSHRIPPPHIVPRIPILHLPFPSAFALASALAFVPPSHSSLPSTRPSLLPSHPSLAFSHPSLRPALPSLPPFLPLSVPPLPPSLPSLSSVIWPFCDLAASHGPSAVRTTTPHRPPQLATRVRRRATSRVLRSTFVSA